MEFFINHIGWFVGGFFICFFAAVGYYADKKEQKDTSNKVDNNVNNDSVKPSVDVDTIYKINNSSVNNVDTGVNIKDDVNIDNKDSFMNEYVNDVSIDDSAPIDYSINVDGTNNIIDLKSNSNNLSDYEWNDDSTNDSNVVQEFDSSLISDNSVNENIDSSDSIESVDMTFDDFLRKDVDITNDSMGVSNSSDGYVDDFVVGYDTSISDKYIVPSNDVGEDFVCSSVLDDETVIPSRVDEMVIPSKDDSDDEIIISSKDDSLDSDDVIIPTNLLNNSESSASQQNVPKDNTIDLYNDSTSDDIWKF